MDRFGLLSLSVLLVATAATVEAQIAIFPEDVQVQPGATVLLPCVAYSSEAEAPISVVWYKDGTVLDNRTSPGRVILHAPATLVKGRVVFTKAVLEVCGVGESDAGTYRCGVLEGDGDAAEFQLQVAPANVPVEIIVAPGTRYMPQNGSAILMCVGVGDPRPNMTWSHNGAALSPTHFSVEQETVTKGGVEFVKTRLELCQITPSEDDLYSCEASNRITTSTASFRLFPDDITFREVPHEFNEGLVSGDITFTCGASGFPTPDVGWTKNGVPLSNSAQLTVETVVTSDDFIQLVRSTLTIRDLGVINSGEYSCTANNEMATIATNFHLAVNVPATAVVAPSNQHLVTSPSSTLSFACAGYGLPSPAIIWKKGGFALSSQPSVVIEESSVVKGGVTFVKSILYLCGGNSVGEYSCTVENNIRNESSSFYIYPEEVGGIIVAPEDMAVVPGDQVMLVCAAIGSDDTEVTWSRDGRPVESRAVGESGMEEVVRDSYTIIKVTLELCVEERDGGVYACIARNALYTETASFEITVNKLQSAPEIVSSDETVVVENRGRNITFSCIARGFPLSDVSWFYEGMELNTGQTRLLITETQNLENDEVASTLLLMHLTERDSGLYTCRAENIMGNTSSEFTLSIIPDSPMTVGVKPKSPVEVAFSHISYSGGLFCSICCLVVLITYLCSPVLRSSQTGRLMSGPLVCNSCIALMALNFSFLLSYFAPQIQSATACVVFSVLFHWLFLVGCFSLGLMVWVMVVLTLWTPEKQRSLLLAVCLMLVWALPLVIGVVSMGASLTNYNSTDFCRPVRLPFWAGLLPFFTLPHLATWLFFFVALCFSCARRNKPGTKVWGAVVALVLFDVAWAAGLASTHPLAGGVMVIRFTLQCIFAVINALLGGALVLFFCLLQVKGTKGLCSKKDIVAPSTNAVSNQSEAADGDPPEIMEEEEDKVDPTAMIRESGEVEEYFQVAYDI